jgi:hypothetical protein
VGSPAALDGAVTGTLESIMGEARGLKRAAEALKVRATLGCRWSGALWLAVSLRGSARALRSATEPRGPADDAALGHDVPAGRRPAGGVAARPLRG